MTSKRTTTPRQTNSKTLRGKPAAISISRTRIRYGTQRNLNSWLTTTLIPVKWDRGNTPVKHGPPDVAPLSRSPRHSRDDTRAGSATHRSRVHEGIFHPLVRCSKSARSVLVNIAKESGSQGLTHDSTNIIDSQKELDYTSQ